MSLYRYDDCIGSWLCKCDSEGVQAPLQMSACSMQHFYLSA